ncbi:MAG: FG-GAP repeat protein [Ignavibacteria bacterium]|nr:FG-GAP repeat protein [Ignavibacteria bacterium]
MKKFIAIAFVLSVLNINALAQSGWFTQSSGTSQHLTAVYFVNGNTGWVVGDNGIILKTTNGGRSWFQQDSQAGNKLGAVQFINANTGWVAGYAATMRKTTNGGENWLPQSIGPAWLPWSFNFVDENYGWIVCEFGIILHTTNGGADWLPQESGTSIDLHSVHFADNRTGWAVGESGIIIATSNGGSNWTMQTSGTGSILSSVQFADNNTGWIAGYYATILKTTNCGTNWTAYASGTGCALRSVHFVKNSIGWVAGFWGAVARTTDGGTNWTPQASNTSELLWSIHFSDYKTGWAVGTYGSIIKTTTGGVWYPPTCMITGPDTVYPGPDVLFVSDMNTGTWSLNNEGGTNALIVSDPGNDSVYVNPGSGNGQFLLAYSSSDSDYCSMAVTVIAPVNLDYSCMYQSSYLFADTRFGYSVNSAGDFNGDGIDDLVIGTPWRGGVVGWAGIYYGPPTCSANMDILIQGEIPNFGTSISPAGDVNGDGYDDVVIGSYGDEYSNTKGRAYIYLGNPSGSQNRIVMEGENIGDGFGYCVSKAGDVNLDGFDDVIISAGGERVFIYLGGQQMNNVPDVILEHEQPFTSFGRSLSYAGDVNGDGFSDVVVGAHTYLNNTGRAYVYFGGRQMDNVPDVIMTGEAVGFDIMLGYYVGSAGDIDNDGFKDVVICSGDEGHAFFGVEVFKGGQTMDNISDVRINRPPDCDGHASTFLNDDFNGDSYSDLLIGASRHNFTDGRTYMYLGSPNMDSRPDYVMSTDSGRFGFSASIAGDVNADGYLDAIRGAPTWGPGQEWGAAFVYYGFGDPIKTLSNLTLSPLFSVSEVGSNENKIALVKNRYDQPMPDIRINFFRRGIQRTYFSGLSGNGGNVSYELNSNTPGVDTVISVSGRYTDTSYIVWKSADDCIAGPQDVGINSTDLYVYSGQTDVRFELMNFESANASIVSGNSNDSVYVESGALNGRYALSVHSGESIMCMEVMNVNSANPVQLTSFTSMVEGKTVMLVWSTANEENNSGFEVQRSESDNEFKTLSFVKAKLMPSEITEYSFSDKNLETGSYNYRLKQIDLNGNFEYFELPEAVTIGIPDKFFLEQNYPNPFNPVTKITFGIPEAGNVKLKIFDMSGREVKTLISEFKEAGYYTVKFDATGLASGAYFYRIETGVIVSVKKMVFLK